jgi:hypothetical protein
VRYSFLSFGFYYAYLTYVKESMGTKFEQNSITEQAESHTYQLGNFCRNAMCLTSDKHHHSKDRYCRFETLHAKIPIPKGFLLLIQF